jgi:hypothetical protein
MDLLLVRPPGWTEKKRPPIMPSLQPPFAAFSLEIALPAELLGIIRDSA